jgi:hypothetical protein
MPLLTRDTFPNLLREFIALQTALQDEFVSIHASVEDWKYLTDVPRSGCVNAGGLSWQYVRHGLGVRFEGTDCTVVDVHNHLLEKGVVDAHRISEYVSSKCKLNDDPDIYDECEKSLEAAKQAGLIEELGSTQRIWRII